MRCPKCKKQLREGAKFCPACGARVKKRQGRRVVAVLLVIILLLGVIAGGLTIGIFAAKHFGNSKSAPKISNVEEAIAHAKELGEELGYENAMSEMTEKVTTEIDGDCYYRLQQNYKGIPVYGRTIVYTTDEKGTTSSITGNILDVSGDVGIRPTLTYSQAIALANSYFQSNFGVDSICKNLSADKNEENLYIYNTAEKAQLVYSIFADAYEILIDANSAGIVSIKQTLNVSSTSTNKSAGANNYTWKNSDDTYVLRDFERNIYIYDAAGNTYWDIYKNTTDPNVLTLVTSKDHIFGNKDDSTTTASTAISFLKALSYAYDYFKFSFSETGCGAAVGIYNDSQGDYNGKNAGGGLMFAEEAIPMPLPDYNRFDHNGQVGVVILGTEYSDSLNNTGSIIDLIGHEYTHYISDKYIAWTHSAIINWEEMELTESNCENGAIREALSDIFGELIEYEFCKKTDWTHGDRKIYNPSENAFPKSAKHEVVRNDKGWVVLGEKNTDYSHGFSTVISHAAYLMWNGEIDYNASKRLNEDELAKLWYRAMLMMPSDCDFIECRTLVELAASTMNLTDLQKQCVCEAFDTVGIPRASEEERSQLVHFVANGMTSIKGTIYEVKTVDGIETVVPVPKATMTVYSDNSTKVYEKLNMKDENGFFEIELHAGTYSVAITAEGYIGQTISFELFDNEVRYFSVELKPSNNNLGNNSDAYNAYLNAAQKTTESGSWSERLDLTANMAITDGSTKTKTKMTMTSDADISNYSESDPSRVRMSGAAEMSVMGQTYAWNMQYENGTAHYQYTKPNQTSADLAIDPGFFNFGTMTSEMMTNAKMSGNQITFTVPGDKITKVGIAAVNQLSGVDDLNYGDVDVTATISNEGTIGTITMMFHASLKYQGYDTDVDYNIVYHFSQSTTGSNNSAVSIVPCSYTNVENKYDILSVHEVNRNQIVFSIWWYKIWDIPEATATLNGNVASFHYIDPVYSTIQAKGTIEFLDGESILTISECSNPNIHNDPYCFAFLSEKLSDQQLKEISRSLGVPDDLNVTIKQGTPGYWEGGSRYRTEVSIFYNGELIAGASVDSLTGDIAGSIYMYSGHTESTSGTLTISETDAYDIACEYWDYTENKVDDETGYQLILSSDGLTEDRNGKKYYAFRLRWFVPTGGQASTLEYLYVDAETGEYKYSIDY